MKGAAYWIAPHGLLTLVFYTTQDHLPSVAPPSVGWGPPLAIVNQKDAPQTPVTATTTQLKFPLPMWLKLTSAS